MPFYGVIIGLVVASAAAMGIGANLDTGRSLMTRNDYAGARESLEAEARAAMARCRDFEGATKILCRASARADDRVRKAELEARYRGTVEAAVDVRLAKAKAAFDVARARCNERTGADRSACLAEARDEKARAVALARASST